MADLYEANSPLWWLDRLYRRLLERQKAIKVIDDYYRGDYQVSLSSRFTRNPDLAELLKASVDNWMAIVPDAVAERLKVEGFRLGKNVAGDAKAWDIWQRNNLDAEADLAHLEALINGEAYTLTWFDDKDPSLARVWVEHPTQMVVATDPGDRRRRVAALKCWIDDDGRTLATLYLPDEIWKFEAPKGFVGSRMRWDEREVQGETNPLTNPLGVVPVVPLTSRRRMLGPGVSEIANVIPVQDRINRLTLDMMVAAYFAAFKQRWATGLAIPKDDNGQPVEPFKAAVDHLWTSSKEGTKFGEFEATDLENYVKAIEMQVQHLAVQTRTPPHYLFLRGNMPSGESLRTAETGLVKKVRQRMGAFSEGWEETMRLAFQIEGKSPRGLVSMETQWADPESRTESEHVDGVMKRVALGVPLRQLWEDVGYSQEQIGRFDEMLVAEAAYQARLTALRGKPEATNAPSENATASDDQRNAG
ncbi:MAG: phage portal protein [Chloroflexi bacterium]|nr:phage portal protein [Chloroflexota bacterium]